MRHTIALAALACAAARGVVLPPYDLECEARRNPVGIDAPQPRLSWKLKSEEQTAYQIQTGISPAAAGLWDSGRSPSRETSWIAYAGPKPESFRRYWWRVRVWNAAGATSLTEAWDANPNSSQNHLMLGHIEEWFYAGLAGIRPQDAGLRYIDIRPQPVGDLTWVKAKWETFRGPVALEWKRDGRNFRLQVSVPPGMTTGVALPGAAAPAKIASGESSFDTVLLP